MLVLQFSWAPAREIDRLFHLASALDISYFHQPVNRSRGRAWGTLQVVWEGSHHIQDLVVQENISVLVPRSTLPAWMVNRIFSSLRKKGVQLLFDADGFPIQERIDFSGLNPKEIEARLLQFQEKQIIQEAAGVLVRSHRAKASLLQRFQDKSPDSFFVLTNGRDPEHFFFDPGKRASLREELGIQPQEMCWVYVGSLGPAYAYQEMMDLFDRVQEKLGNLRFLFLPNDLDFAKDQLISRFPDRLILRKVPFSEVPGYLSAADFGLNFRKSAPSLKALFPIKLGEYLLCGLPVFASREVGDTEDWVAQVSGIVAVDLQSDQLLATVLQAMETSPKNPERIRNEALPIFSLDHSLSAYREALDYLKPHTG